MNYNIYDILELLLILLKTEIAVLSLTIVSLTFLLFCMVKIIGTQRTILFNLFCSFVTATMMSLTSYHLRYGFDTHKFKKERECALISTNIGKLCTRI